MEYDTHSLKDGRKGYVSSFTRKGKDTRNTYMRMITETNKQTMVRVIEKKGDINERVSESV